jgi:hypothetical protein
VGLAHGVCIPFTPEVATAAVRLATPTVVIKLLDNDHDEYDDKGDDEDDDTTTKKKIACPYDPAELLNEPVVRQTSNKDKEDGLLPAAAVACGVGSPGRPA